MMSERNPTSRIYTPEGGLASLVAKLRGTLAPDTDTWGEAVGRVTPIISDAYGIRDAVEAYHQGDQLSAGLSTAASLAGMGGLGGVLKSTKGAAAETAAALRKSAAPLTKEAFEKMYGQHIDIRGRAGTAASNLQSIKDKGFNSSFLNVSPTPWRGDDQVRTYADKLARPKQGDTVYLIPRDQTIKGKVAAGWKPEQHEVITNVTPDKSIYQQYLDMVLHE